MLARLPMKTAPRDGTRILVQRHVNPAYQGRAPQVGPRRNPTIAFWRPPRPGAANHGFWMMENSAGAYAQDENLEGWWPLPSIDGGEVVALLKDVRFCAKDLAADDEVQADIVRRIDDLLARGS